ncbi:MAG TPA: cysteine desulfurase family protein [Feifaniaceae bacterium]|nr:cysteine desulfurase family protein [Feifaniaceae bacterium]
MIYLDNSATTRPLEEAAAAVKHCFEEEYYNPSSAYGPAVRAERSVNDARARLAQALGAAPAEIVYTSGATESNNMAIIATQFARHTRGTLITTKTEHPSVFEVYRFMENQGYAVEYLDVDEDGAVRMDALAAALTPSTALVSIMQVNNETGAVNDIAQAQALIRSRAPQALFHVDGVQAFCKMPFNKVPCDLYSISAHKFHGPKGIGALYVRQNTPFLGGFIGGGQERGLRSGTTNTPGILGMDAALTAYRSNHEEWVSAMRANKIRLAEYIRQMPDTVINGPRPENGAPHILNASFLGVRGEVLLHALEERGILVSTGSACSAHKKGKNRILAAMGIAGPRQEGALRFSLCPFNTAEEMDVTAQALFDTVAFLRRYRRR